MEHRTAWPGDLQKQGYRLVICFMLEVGMRCLLHLQRLVSLIVSCNGGLGKPAVHAPLCSCYAKHTTKGLQGPNQDRTYTYTCAAHKL